MPEIPPTPPHPLTHPVTHAPTHIPRLARPNIHGDTPEAQVVGGRWEGLGSECEGWGCKLQGLGYTRAGSADKCAVLVYAGGWVGYKSQGVGYKRGGWGL